MKGIDCIVTDIIFRDMFEAEREAFDEEGVYFFYLSVAVFDEVENFSHKSGRHCLKTIDFSHHKLNELNNVGSIVLSNH